MNDNISKEELLKKIGELETRLGEQDKIMELQNNISELSNEAKESELEGSLTKSKALETSIKRVETYLISRLKETFSRIAAAFTESMTNQVKFRKFEPQKQVKERATELSLAGKDFTKEEIEEYADRAKAYNAKKLLALNDTNKKLNPYYSSTFESMTGDALDYLYDDHIFNRMADDWKIPDGYNAYRTGG